MAFSDSVALNVPQMLLILEECYALIICLALICAFLADRRESQEQMQGSDQLGYIRELNTSTSIGLEQDEQMFGFTSSELDQSQTASATDHNLEAGLLPPRRNRSSSFSASSFYPAESTQGSAHKSGS